MSCGSAYERDTVKKTLLRLALAFGGLVIGLVLAEVGCRVASPGGATFVAGALVGGQDPNLVEVTPRSRRLRPNVETVHSSLEYEAALRTNELGLRGGPITPRRDGELRILTVGDSFTLARQVEEDETFTALLAEGTGGVAWNAGVDGYSTYEATEQLERMVRDVRPDVVVLSFYLGNDLRDNASGGGPPAPIGHAPRAIWAEDLAMSLGTRSALAAHLTARMLLAQGADDFRFQEHRDEIAVMVEPDVLDRDLEATRRALEGFGQACQSARARCIVGLIPPAYVVHDERAAATYEAFDLDPSQADFERVARAVAEAVPAGLDVVDLSPALQEAAADEAMYFTYDPHWTAEAHRVAAEVYLETLNR